MSTEHHVALIIHGGGAQVREAWAIIKAEYKKALGENWMHCDFTPLGAVVETANETASFTIHPSGGSYKRDIYARHKMLRDIAVRVATSQRGYCCYTEVVLMSEVCPTGISRSRFHDINPQLADQLVTVDQDECKGGVP